MNRLASTSVPSSLCSYKYYLHKLLKIVDITHLLRAHLLRKFYGILRALETAGTHPQHFSINVGNSRRVLFGRTKKRKYLLERVYTKCIMYSY